MYSTWRITELKAELKKRGASCQGKKAELVARLEAYDRNFNFANIAIQNRQNSPELQVELPEEGLYRDVNSDTLLPPLTKQNIYLYFSRFNKKIEDGFRMYEERYLLVVRSCRVGDITYVKGICKASMKKIQYEVNLKLLHNGDIEECACECAVGCGKEAHCKHTVVMFGIEQMVREKFMIKNVVCTQSLQTFHQPKKSFTASPLKAEKLPFKRRRLSNIIFHPFNMDNICKYSYNTRVRNIIIGATSSTMPLKQIYCPANPFGVLNDHKYTKKDQRDILLKNLHLTDVKKFTIVDLEIKTRGQSNNPLWYEMRQDRITASKFHTVCHLTAQRQKSFAEQLLFPQTFRSRAITHGIINEPVAIKAYMERFEVEIQNCGLFISEKYPFLGASPDGLLGEETLIEVKCPYASRNHIINETTVAYLCKQNGELFLKKTCPYYYQIQGQLFVIEKKICNLVIYTFKDMKIIYISRDEDFIKNMLSSLVSFYETYFKEALYNKYIYRNYK